MVDLLKSLLPRIVQDVITSAAAILATHGYLAADQQQGFIGSAFFLIMLAVNYFLSQNRKANAAIVGANTVGAPMTYSTASAIAKTGKPQ
jgi:hypothetical protein